jgi:hypothetical protein
LGKFSSPNDHWQLWEERKGESGNSLNQYLWRPYYIVSLAVRWYDSGMEGNLAESHHTTKIGKKYGMRLRSKIGRGGRRFCSSFENG